MPVLGLRLRVPNNWRLVRRIHSNQMRDSGCERRHFHRGLRGTCRGSLLVSVSSDYDNHDDGRSMFPMQIQMERHQLGHSGDQQLQSLHLHLPVCEWVFVLSNNLDRLRRDDNHSHEYNRDQHDVDNVDDLNIQHHDQLDDQLDHNNRMPKPHAVLLFVPM
jgi:hypothetical protein